LKTPSTRTIQRKNWKSLLLQIIAINEITGDCYVITVYFPNSDIWQAGFEKRRES